MGGGGDVLGLTKMTSEGMKEFKEGEWPKLLLLSSPWTQRDKMETLENEPDQ